MSLFSPEPRTGRSSRILTLGLRFQGRQRRLPLGLGTKREVYGTPSHPEQQVPSAAQEGLTPVKYLQNAGCAHVDYAHAFVVDPVPYGRFF